MSSEAIMTLALAALVIVAAGTVAALVLPRARRRKRLAAPSPERPAPREARGDGHDAGAGALTSERAALDERTERAERADALRNLLVSKMSHDLRTPLNSVITLSQLLSEGSVGALTLDQRKYIEIIQRNGQTLLGLVNDILDLASLEAGRIEIDAAPFDLRALARAVGDAGAAAAKRKGLPLHVNLPRRRVLARADEERLRHALTALVDHAVTATRNGYVEISVDGDADRAVVRVSDTGSGLAREARSAIFDDFLAGVGPFTGRAVPPLSLVIAGRLVRLMGGSIAVDSVDGEGTTLSVALPSAPEDALSPAPALTAQGSGPIAEPSTGHVLLIEDDEIERRRIGSLLESLGYEVTSTPSGDEGLALLGAAHYDAVVLDLVMPGMSGLDVLRRARSDDHLAGVPFVVLSALYMTKSERDVLGPSVVGVVRKGDSTADELAAQLRRAVAASAAAGAGAEHRPAPATPRARVLVVEDNIDNLFTIEQVLASLPVTIETASSGPEAVELCRRRPPDLVMMDVELPGMSGLEASRAIHALPDCAGIPIIAITAQAMHGDRERALEAQCSGYLAKPVQPLDVVSAVTRALHLAAH